MMITKKIAISGLTIFLLLISAFSLVSCDSFSSFFALPDDKNADNKLISFIECLKTEDANSLKSLFAKNKIANLTNFDLSIEELFQYYDGEFVSINRYSTGVEKDKDSGIERKWYNMSYDVTTSIEIYRMAFIWCVKDTSDDNNVGIESYYILKASEDPNYPQYAYGGDGSWTPGINIGKIYVD